MARALRCLGGLGRWALIGPRIEYERGRVACGSGMVKGLEAECRADWCNMRGPWREGALGRWVASAEPVYEDARAGARERAVGIKAWCGFAVLRVPRTAFSERWEE